jgi:hypothetical protein
MNKIIKTVNLLEGIIAAGLGVNSVVTAANGNYKVAAIEAVASLWIGASAYFESKKIKLIYETAPLLAERVKQVDKSLDERFQELFKTLETYSR